MNCLICNKELSSAKAFPGHLTAKHHMTTKQYYDTYLRKENEGICSECGKETRFVNMNVGYKQFCSLKCATPHIQEKAKATCLERYGVENFGQSEQAREKSKQTMQEKYGVDYYCLTEDCIEKGHTDKAKQKAKDTCNEKYGVSCGFNTEQCRKAAHSDEANKKRIETNINRHGKPFTFDKNHTPEANVKRENTFIEKYGVSHNFKRPEIIKNAVISAHSSESLQKMHDSRYKNGWTRSSIEDNFANTLNSYGIEYKHNFISDQYPWKVDFYIPKYNLYIEINNFWTHNTHYYNEKNDLDEKQLIEQKVVINGFYKTNLDVWTNRDIAKRDWAIEHNLNYVVLWNQLQIDQFFEDLNNNKNFIGFIDYNNFIT